MRFGLIDLLFLTACLAVGVFLVLPLAPLPRNLGLLASYLVGFILYAVLIYPFYRGLRLYPMILPRCPCCRQFQQGFHFCGGWPRVLYRCPTCNGEFVIWLNGTVGNDETWERPVLALKWPYAWGVYKRMEKPQPDKAGSAETPS